MVVVGGGVGGLFGLLLPLVVRRVFRSSEDDDEDDDDDWFDDDLDDEPVRMPACRREPVTRSLPRKNRLRAVPRRLQARLGAVVSQAEAIPGGPPGRKGPPGGARLGAKQAALPGAPSLHLRLRSRPASL